MIPPGLVLAGTEAQHGSTHDQSRICGVVWSYVTAVVEVDVEALRRGHERRETCDREIDPLSQPSPAASTAKSPTTRPFPSPHVKFPRFLYNRTHPQLLLRPISRRIGPRHRPSRPDLRHRQQRTVLLRDSKATLNQATHAFYRHPKQKKLSATAIGVQLGTMKTDLFANFWKCAPGGRVSKSPEYSLGFVERLEESLRGRVRSLRGRPLLIRTLSDRQRYQSTTSNVEICSLYPPTIERFHTRYKVQEGTSSQNIGLAFHLALFLQPRVTGQQPPSGISHIATLLQFS